MINGFACEFNVYFGNCFKLKIFDGRKRYNGQNVHALMCNQQSKLIKFHALSEMSDSTRVLNHSTPQFERRIIFSSAVAWEPTHKRRKMLHFACGHLRCKLVNQACVSWFWQRLYSLLKFNRSTTCTHTEFIRCLSTQLHL